LVVLSPFLSIRLQERRVVAAVQVKGEEEVVAVKGQARLTKVLKRLNDPNWEPLTVMK
jgi:hypothetical protein